MEGAPVFVVSREASGEKKGEKKRSGFFFINIICSVNEKRGEARGGGRERLLPSGSRMSARISGQGGGGERGKKKGGEGPPSQRHPE